MLKKVVLPAPLGPMIETIDRGLIEKSTSSTATRPPKILETSLALESASPSADGLRRCVAGFGCSLMRAPRRCDSSPPTPSVSSILRLRSGSRPSGLSTIISTRMKPNTPNETWLEAEVEPEVGQTVADEPSPSSTSGIRRVFTNDSSDRADHHAPDAAQARRG